MSSMQVLTEYEIRRLSSTQDPENVRWRIFRREPLVRVGLASDAPDLLLYIARGTLISMNYPDPEVELEVLPRSGGRFIIRDAAFMRPLLEFSPTVPNTPNEDNHD